MATDSKNYVDYLQVDESYYPIINTSTIEEAEKNDPDFWMLTYPHERFLEMLKGVSQSLRRVQGETKSLWIEGAYGSGKSHCAYALQRILQAAPEKLEAYGRRYADEFREEPNLLADIAASKAEKRVVTAYRYGSADVETDAKFFYELQQTVVQTLKAEGIDCELGSLRNTVVSWLSVSHNKAWLDAVLASSDYFASRMTADAIVAKLKGAAGEGEINSLMNGIFQIAEDNGLNAFQLTITDLCEWLRDVVTKNNIQLVFIWDEFTEFFNGRNSFTSFQTLSELCGSIPFYFVAVTHNVASYFNDAKSWKKINDRFTRVEIELPENVALQLIGHALPPRADRAEEWRHIASDLNDDLKESREAVEDATKIKEESVMKKIMPIHPMAALVLKHLSSMFRSNQRSMFDFIKTADSEAHAFQHFINNHSPFGRGKARLLTVDYLWNFFYERGSKDLEEKIKSILDRYNDLRPNLANDKEERVLKTTLILQALAAGANEGRELLYPTIANLKLTFEGIGELEGDSCANIVKSLANQGILIERPLGRLKVYNVETAVSGDSGFRKIEKRIRENVNTDDLIAAGSFEDVLDLTDALALRFGIGSQKKAHVVCEKNFRSTLASLADKQEPFNAIVGVAFNADEGQRLRQELADASAAPAYNNIVFIDATAVTMKPELVEQYVTNLSWADFYQQSGDRDAARKYVTFAKKAVTEWKSTIQRDVFVVLNRGTEEQINGYQGVKEYLRKHVLSKYRYAFEFAGVLTEAMLGSKTLHASAMAGITKQTSGSVGSLETRVFANKTWPAANYWKETPEENISKVKIGLESFAETKFNENGRVAVKELWEYLVSAFGFTKSNLYAFLFGFLVRDYLEASYRFMKDGTDPTPQALTADLLAASIESAISSTPKAARSKDKGFPDALIVRQTPQEKAACNLAQVVFEEHATVGNDIVEAFRNFVSKRGYPIEFVLDSLAPTQRPFVELFVAVAEEQDDNRRAELVEELGTKALATPGKIDSQLAANLSEEAFVKGAESFLQHWNDGALYNAAEEIGASTLYDVKEALDKDVNAVFNPARWGRILEELQQEYAFVSITNVLLKSSDSSKTQAILSWQNKIQTTFVSYEHLPASLVNVGRFLQRLSGRTEESAAGVVVEESVVQTLAEHGAELLNYLQPDLALFRELYSDCYDPELSEDDLNKLVQRLPDGMFESAQRRCEEIVRRNADDILKDRLKNRVVNLWKEKTGTLTPREWSDQARVPVQCMLDAREQEKGLKALNTLNAIATSASDDLDAALDFFSRTSLFSVLDDEDEQSERFNDCFLKTRPTVTVEEAQDALYHRQPDVMSWYDNFRKTDEILDELVNQKYDAVRTDLSAKWRDKTGTANPRDWSNRFSTPIQCMANPYEKETLDVVFKTLNAPQQAKNEQLDEVSAWFETQEAADLFARLADAGERDRRFSETFLTGQLRLLSHDDAADELQAYWANVWDWFSHISDAHKRLDKLTERVYKTRKDDVIHKIDEMSDAKLRSYLKRMLENNPKIGIEILLDGSDD